MRDRIRAMFLGIQIGDCLGMPVETFTAKDIAEKYGRVDKYLIPKDHKWFNGDPAGMYTDDTQLTIAVANAMIEAPLCMETQAEHHVKALKQSTKGWGRSTKDSVRKVANGCHWSKSAEGSTGAGNGVAMKIASIAAYYTINQKKTLAAFDGFDDYLHNMSKSLKLESMWNCAHTYQFFNDLTRMTHVNPIALQAGYAQHAALHAVLACPKNTFLQIQHEFVSSCILGETLVSESQEMRDDPCLDNLHIRYKDMFDHFDELTTEIVIEEFNGGDCYAFNSVPFSHYFFFKNPTSIDALYDCVSAGGDADSNGSMVGGLLGALNGMEIFPQHLIDGLLEPNVMLELADRFCDKFEIE